MLSKLIPIIRKSQLFNKIRNDELLKVVRNLPFIYHSLRFCYKKAFDLGVGGRFYGVFKSHHQALDHLGPNIPRSYEDIDLSDIHVQSFQEMHLFDYPIIFWLMKLNGNFQSLIDLGGHIGVKYYAYSSQMPSLKKIKWNVIDVPHMLKRGRIIASERQAENLKFSEDISLVEHAEILFISGTLQYLDTTIGEILAKIDKLPAYVLLNKVPLHNGPNLWTIENFGRAKIPYGISNRDEFKEIMRNRNYRLTDSWSIKSRSISIPFYENKLDGFAMTGQVWELVE